MITAQQLRLNVEKNSIRKRTIIAIYISFHVSDVVSEQHFPERKEVQLNNEDCRRN